MMNTKRQEMREEAKAGQEGAGQMKKIYTTYEEYGADIDLMLDNGYDTVSNHYDADGNLVVTYERIAN